MYLLVQGDDLFRLAFGQPPSPEGEGIGNASKSLPLQGKVDCAKCKTEEVVTPLPHADANYGVPTIAFVPT